MAKCKVEEYDRIKLREARRLIMAVYQYYYGAPNSVAITSRLENMIRELDNLLEERED